MRPGLRNPTHNWEAASPSLSPPPSRYHYHRHHRLCPLPGWLRAEPPDPHSWETPGISPGFSPKSGCGSEGPPETSRVSCDLDFHLWGAGGWGGKRSAFLSRKHPRNALLIPSTKRAPISVQGVEEQKIRSRAWTLSSLGRRGGRGCGPCRALRPAGCSLAGSTAGNAVPAPSQIPRSDGSV